MSMFDWIFGILGLDPNGSLSVPLTDHTACLSQEDELMELPRGLGSAAVVDVC